MRNIFRQSLIAKCSLASLLLGVLVCGVNTSAQAQAPNFGPNVYIFTPSMSATSINSTLATLAGNAQFDTNRYAVLFQPGTYTGVEAQVGYYESVAGLGQTPNATHVTNGYLTVNTTDSNGNVTQNFWRSIENMQITAPAGDTLQWAVSQGAAFRRMYVDGSDGVELTNGNCGEASGGFMSDSLITANLSSCSQQQWYTRNSSIGSWSGNLWNMVFSGVSGAPAQSVPFGTSDSYTTLATTPASREKPFLYVDANGNYFVFSPSLLTNSSGTSWSTSNMGAGTSLPISSFLIATPSTSLATINSWLQTAGQNLILTPGIYTYSGSINVTNASTVVLGLGYADLIPQTGTAAITVADVGGVQLAGFLIDAGPVNSPVLFQVGVAGASRVSHASNPTSISDVYFRIGGYLAGSATTSLEIDSDNVIVDNMWAWRADHGAGASWTGNPAAHGVVVNGDNVLATGLAVEHYQQNQVVWNGNGGETIFYQSEMPYDVPSQAAWMNGSVDGYASYDVAPSVTSHQAYGLGVYSYFEEGVAIIANSGITAPVATGVTFTDSVSVFLAGSGQINYNIASDNGTVDNAGTTALSGSYISYVTSWGGSAGSCGAAPSVPSAPTSTPVSSSQINLTWGASTAGNGCTVSYNLFRSTTAGFTPGAANQIASGLTTTSYSNTGLPASTTYYYAVEAADGAGSSAATALTSATTQGAVVPTPNAPSNLTATAASTSQINLSWTASSTSGVTYSIFRSTSSGTQGTQIATGQTGTSYTDTGLTASTTYYYEVEAANSAGNSTATNQANATTQTSVTCTGAPAIPGNPSATAASSSQINLSWTASSTSGVTYSIFRSTSSGTQGTQIATGQTGTSYSDTGLTASTTYYYEVEAVNSAGTSAATTQTSATTSTNGTGGTDVVAINSGGAATGSFSADEDFTGGGTYSVTNTINVSAANAAPAVVYQTERQGTITYTLPGLTSGNSYTVRLHFAELYFTAAGDRAFDVAINGTPVLTNFDIYATAGAAYKAVVETFTATANSSGDIVVALTNGTENQPLINGIEVLGSGSGPVVPSAPLGLTATAASSSQINLSWTASSTSGVTYNVYRSTTSGFTAATGNQIAASQTGTSYVDMGLSASTTYYYVVEANNSAGNSVASNQASATTQAPTNGGGTDVLAINAGGAATGSFSADEDFTGGGTYSVTNTINVSAANAAPAAVYQSARQGATTYTLPGLTSGSSYTVRLHFAELYFTAAGGREFDVAINGTPVLTNFDIYATAGAAYKAVVETFTATANSSGQIVVSFSNGSADQPMFNGLEVQGSVTTPVPNAPSNLTATATSSSQINLAWTASTTSGVTYDVYRSTTAGFTPAAGNQVATGITATSYASTGLTASTTYYYAVEASNSAGNSASSNQASATTQAGPTGGTDIFAINSGGAVSGTFTADEDFIGGGTYSVTNTITTTGVTNPAPAAVYQSARQGAFTYTLPGLVAGSSHTVRLHFAELYFTAAGQREFDVAINGTAVLTNFDIVGTTGAAYKAVVEQFTTTANSSGQIVITFSNGALDQPMLSGIEVQ